MSKRNVSVLVVAMAALLCSLITVPVFADSQARIVRLSSVDGDVQIDRNADQGFEKAFLNLPIIQGAKIKVGHDGRAEVEFEDGSTLRTGPDTQLQFTQLSLRDSGARASAVTISSGTAYVNFKGKKDEEFTLSFGRETVQLTQAAHFRVQMRDAEAALAVFKGSVQAQGNSGKVEVSQKREATFNLADSDRFTVAENISSDPLDAWDKDLDEYHTRYTAKNSGNSAYSYGGSDLSYYGNYVNAPGYGMMWQPYFAGAGWDPFMNGAWTWYPGYGYTFVSAYPWGWQPYRYGSWMFVPGYGWGWQPGSGWQTWNNRPVILHQPAHYQPPQPPISAGHGTVIVGRGFVAAPSSTKKIVLEPNSAGMGVPRGGIRDLGKVSRDVNRSGPITTTVRPIAPAPATTSTGRTTRPTTTTPRTSTPRSTPTSSPSMSTPRSSPTPKHR